MIYASAPPFVVVCELADNLREFFTRAGWCVITGENDILSAAKSLDTRMMADEDLSPLSQVQPISSVQTWLGKFAAGISPKRMLLYHVYGASIWSAIRENQARSLRTPSNHRLPQARSVHLNTINVSKEHIGWQSATEMSHVGPVSLGPDSAEEETDQGHCLMYGLLPPMSSLGHSYYVISTLVHIFHTLYNIICYRMILDQEGRYYLLSCYMPRLIISEQLHHSLAIQISVTWSLILLVWRALMFARRRSMPFDTLEFLLVDEDILEKIRHITITGQQFVFDPQMVELVRSPRFASIRDNLFYWCERRGQHFLRPNRTAHAYRRLIGSIELFTSLMLIVSVTFMGAITIDGFRTLIFSQEKFYTVCDIVLFDLGYFLRILGSLSLGFVYITDTILFLGFGVVFSFHVVEDILLYWTELVKRIDDLRDKLSRSNAILVEYRRQTSCLAAAGWHRKRIKRTSRRRRRTDCLGEIQQGRVVTVINQQRNVMSEQERRRLAVGSYGLGVEREAEKLQRSLFDFFTQLGRANKYASSLISVGLSILLVFNICFTLNGAQTSTKLPLVDQIVIRVIQLWGLVLTVIMSGIVLRLKTKTEPAYVELSTLMAYDSSGSKTYWSKLLCYYTGKPAYAFTYLNGQIFSRLSLMKILSYTITFVLFVESQQLTRQQGKLHDPHF